MNELIDMILHPKEYKDSIEFVSCLIIGLGFGAFIYSTCRMKEQDDQNRKGE